MARAAVRFLSILLRAVLGLAQVSAQTMTWYPANISSDRLSSIFSFNSQSKVICASKATQTPWCHLFTYDSGNCSLYNQKIKRHEDESALGPTTPCWTKYYNECFVGEVVYSHGDKFEQKCMPVMCMQGEVISDLKVPDRCSPPFTEVAGLGCVYLVEEPKSFCDARRHCSNLGADLAVPQNFSILERFFEDRLDDQIWVGVKALEWLDGRPVLYEEWGPKEPNGRDTYCARLSRYDDKHLLADIGCDKSYIFLCQHKEPSET